MTAKKAAPGKPGAKGIFRTGADYDRAALIADWKSGNYSQRELGVRYGITQSSVSAAVKGIPRNAPGAKRGRRHDSELDEKQCMTREERRRYVRFFNTAGMVVARAAVRRVKTKPDLSMVEMRQASEIVSGQRAGILGKQPETAIQINTGASAAGAEGNSTTLEQYRQAREKIVGEF